jgi:hypothetical protein
MPLNMKVVSHEKLHNYCIGKIWSVYMNFGEHGKSSRVAMDVKGFGQGFD